jgi:hypothetical protein
MGAPATNYEELEVTPEIPEPIQETTEPALEVTPEIPEPIQETTAP